MTLPKMPRFSCRFPLGLVIAEVLAVLPTLSVLGSAPTADAVQPATPVSSAVALGLRIRDLCKAPCTAPPVLDGMLAAIPDEFVVGPRNDVGEIVVLSDTGEVTAPRRHAQRRDPGRRWYVSISQRCHSGRSIRRIASAAPAASCPRLPRHRMSEYRRWMNKP
jgi:hypothetical protein